MCRVHLYFNFQVKKNGSTLPESDGLVFKSRQSAFTTYVLNSYTILVQYSIK